jgi:hypothetical protein
VAVARGSQSRRVVRDFIDSPAVFSQISVFFGDFLLKFLLAENATRAL